MDQSNDADKFMNLFFFKIIYTQCQTPFILCDSDAVYWLPHLDTLSSELTAR